MVNHTISKAGQLEDKYQVLTAAVHGKCMGIPGRLTCLGPPSGRWAPVETKSPGLCSQDPVPLSEVRQVQGRLWEGVVVMVTTTGSPVGRMRDRNMHCISGYKTREPVTCLLVVAVCLMLCG